ncbi:hypothetical protein M514_27646 [Trichuris suis]|uniref:Reverse transcriptase domain-containing protein n=1 Tax=Trichuris suis TaxID=68888 RepID=A0A085MSI2_9BILA|nr:hypothetical protein M514_27646 [Trichuris suis]
MERRWGPLSPVLVEVFTEHFECQLFSHTSTDVASTYFKRYVDDVFAIFPRGKEDSFLEIMKNEFPNVIVFTIEKEGIKPQRTGNQHIRRNTLVSVQITSDQ